MISRVLSGMDGVDVYAIAGLLIFLPFFAAVTWYVFSIRKEEAEAMSRIPLGDEPATGDAPADGVS